MCLHAIVVMIYTDWMQATNALGVMVTDWTCLIIDEVDRMSAGDRGGMDALSTPIKKTKVHYLSVSHICELR